jgi:hypothetical protein
VERDEQTGNVCVERDERTCVCGERSRADRFVLEIQEDRFVLERDEKTGLCVWRETRGEVCLCVESDETGFCVRKARGQVCHC